MALTDFPNAMTYYISVYSSDTETRVKCTWSISSSSYWQLVNTTFTVVEELPIAQPNAATNCIVFRKSTGSTSEFEISQQDDKPKGMHMFLWRLFFSLGTPKGTKTRLAGLILPASAGYLVRADIISLRLVDCELFENIVSFQPALQYFDEVDVTIAEFYQLLLSAAGGFYIRENPDQTYDQNFQNAVTEMKLRMSIPWILEEKSSAERLVLVEGGRARPEHGGVAASIYSAAKALGIKLIVVDESEHWLQNEQHEDQREAFLEIQFEPSDASLTDRLVDALKQYPLPIHGIVTFCDSYQASVAAAAERLLLPTSPPEAYRIVTNKYRVTEFVGRRVYRCFKNSFSTTAFEENHLKYPLIVKPCKGWGSEGVYRVNDIMELVHAIKRIDSDRHGTEFMVEEYCDGPEVDVNMVLYDGQLLFCEISDDYPKSAEGNHTGALETFIEMDSVAPTNLPPQECELLRDAFYQSLLKMGLQYGVFHVEGRMHNSSMEYVLDDSGLRDLEPRRVACSTAPTAWMLDPNPRPPGMTASMAPQTTYGVEYHGLALLIALRDHERVHALSRPFTSGNQYWSVMVYIPTDYPKDRKGIFDSDDICESLKARRPDLVPHISNCLSLVKKGDHVPHPETGINTWVAYFNVFSRTSRRHVLELASSVRQEVQFSFL